MCLAPPLPVAQTFLSAGFGDFPIPKRTRNTVLESTYVFSVVGTSRCDVRAACSGATPSNASAARSFVPPATTRAGTAQRAIPTLALNTHLASDGRGRVTVITSENPKSLLHEFLAIRHFSSCLHCAPCR